MSQGNRKVQFWVALAVSLASVTTGVVLSWIAAALPKLMHHEANIQIRSLEQLSWVAALASPGFIAGSLASKFISDRFGRRPTILGSAFPVLIGTIFAVSTSTVWPLYLTKFLWGIGTGMIVTVSSIYLAEISDKDIRGAITSSCLFMCSLGSFLVMVVGPLVTYDTLNYLVLALPILFFIACWFIPETPYFTLKVGKVEQAEKILKKIRKYNNGKELEEDLDSMQKDVKKETVRSGSLKELFTGRQYRRAVVVCLGIKITQMLSGTIVLQHYLSLMLMNSTIDIKMRTAFFTFGGVWIISGIVASVLVDRVGRRPLLILSYMGTGLALSLSGVYYFCLEVIKIEQETIAPYGIVAFAGIILSVIFSTIGHNSLVYVLPAEMFPLNVKSVAMTALNVFGELLNFVILSLFHYLIDLIGLFGVFTMVAVVSFAGSIFSFYLVPETRGKSLREIIDILQGTAYDEAAENLNKVTATSENEVPM